MANIYAAKICLLLNFFLISSSQEMYFFSGLLLTYQALIFCLPGYFFCLPGYDHLAIRTTTSWSRHAGIIIILLKHFFRLLLAAGVAIKLPSFLPSIDHILPES